MPKDKYDKLRKIVGPDRLTVVGELLVNMLDKIKDYYKESDAQLSARLGTYRNWVRNVCTGNLRRVETRDYEKVSNLFAHLYKQKTARIWDGPASETIHLSAIGTTEADKEEMRQRARKADCSGRVLVTPEIISRVRACAEVNGGLAPLSKLFNLGQAYFSRVVHGRFKTIPEWIANSITDLSKKCESGKVFSYEDLGRKMADEATKNAKEILNDILPKTPEKLPSDFIQLFVSCGVCKSSLSAELCGETIVVKPCSVCIKHSEKTDTKIQEMQDELIQLGNKVKELDK